MTRVSSAVRDLVRQRANYRCEYCRKPEGIGMYSHHVDHIIASKHGGTSELDNLAWACFQCNTTKSSDVASYDRLTHALTPLYNPRLDSWDEHFRLEGALITGITPVGRVTVNILQMNHPDQINTRIKLIENDRW